MKKICFLFISTLSLGISYAQSFEEKISDKSCECIKELKEVNDENYINCISTSLAEIAINDQKYMKVIGTVEGMTSTIKKADSIIKKTCDFFVNPLERKKEIFYSDSEDEIAYSFYFTSTDMMMEEKYDIAIEGFLIAVELDENYVNAFDHLAMCYRKLNQFDNAIKYYEKSLDIFPEGDYALMNMGVIYRLKEDYNESIKYYSKLVQYYPNNAEGYFGLSQNYFLLENNEKALDNAFKAYLIYLEEDSPYKNDAELIINAIEYGMRSEGKEKIFRDIAAANNITIE